MTRNPHAFGNPNSLSEELRSAGSNDINLVEGAGAPISETDLKNLVAKYGQDESTYRTNKEEYTLVGDEAIAEVYVRELADDGLLLADAEIEEENREVQGLLEEDREANQGPDQGYETNQGVDVIR